MDHYQDIKSDPKARCAPDVTVGCTSTTCRLISDPIREGWYWWPKALDFAYALGPYASRGHAIAAARGASALQGPV